MGQGDRQYLTGLKMGGRRILILVDTSASMLDETIVNIIRQRNLPDAQKKRSGKWRRTLRTADWLASQLPPASKFQLYLFNETAVPALADTKGRWLDVSNAAKLDSALNALSTTIPAGGTSLHNAFAVIRSLNPRPDNVLLVTDGLPTQGAKKRSGKVSGEKRMRYFNKAVAKLPSGIPVNTILLPMEGDPLAVSAFWKLAISTRGSLLTPSRDWP